MQPQMFGPTSNINGNVRPQQQQIYRSSMPPRDNSRQQHNIVLTQPPLFIPYRQSPPTSIPMYTTQGGPANFQYPQQYISPQNGPYPNMYYNPQVLHSTAQHRNNINQESAEFVPTSNTIVNHPMVQTPLMNTSILSASPQQQHVSVVPPQLYSRPSRPKRARPFAIPIIDPGTQKEKVIDLKVDTNINTASSSSSTVEYHDLNIVNVLQQPQHHDISTVAAEQHKAAISSTTSSTSSSSGIAYTTGMPIVSANLDTPHIEIQTKRKSKALEIVAPTAIVENKPTANTKVSSTETIDKPDSSKINENVINLPPQQSTTIKTTTVVTANDESDNHHDHSNNDKAKNKTENKSKINNSITIASTTTTTNINAIPITAAVMSVAESDLPSPLVASASTESIEEDSNEIVPEESAVKTNINVEIEENNRLNTKAVNTTTITTAAANISTEEITTNTTSTITSIQDDSEIDSKIQSKDETDRVAVINEVSNVKSISTTVAAADLIAKVDDKLKNIAENDKSTTNIVSSVVTSSAAVESVATVTAAAATDATTTTAAAATTTATVAATKKSLINYNDGQWSPENQSGNRTYDRNQLLILRDAPLSRAKPEVEIKLTIQSSSKSPQAILMPAFASRSNNKRMQYGGNMGGGGGSGNYQYSKQSSMSGVNPKNNAKGSKSDAIHVSLSLREEIVLNSSENAWRPTHITNDKLTTEERSLEELKRKVRGILNKLTPENFETLVEQIIKLQIDTMDKVNEVMILVFEKAIDEPNFSTSYARLCFRLASEVKEVKTKDDSSGNEEAKNFAIFRCALLDKTEREFTDNVTNRKAKELKLQPISDRMNEIDDLAKKQELKEELEREESKIRRRSGGTVRFIGELFKINMLTGNIIRKCIEQLLDPSSEDKLECLCKLITTVGKKYESTVCSKDAKPPQFFNLDAVIKKMQLISEQKLSDSNKISNRIRFMLQDVIDLRVVKWSSTRNDAPKTMEQIQKDAKNEQLSNQYLNYAANMSNKKDDNRNNDGGYGGASNSNSGGGGSNQRGGNMGGGGNMSLGGGGGGNNSGNNSGRNNNNNNNNNNNVSNRYFNNKNNRDSQQQQQQQSGEDTWYTKTSKGNKPIDTHKLGQILNCGDTDTVTPKLGGSQQFMWNHGAGSNNASRQKTTSNSFAALSKLEKNTGGGGGPLNKNSYTKNNSMERDRYDHRPNSRTGSSHSSRESSSNRNNNNNNNLPTSDLPSGGSTMHKSGSHQNFSSSLLKQSISSSSSSSSNRSKSTLSSSVTTTVAAAASSAAIASAAVTAIAADNTTSSSTDMSSSRSAAAVASSYSNIPQSSLIFDDVDDCTDKMLDSFKKIIETASESTSMDNIIPIVELYSESKRWGLFYVVLCEYLHLHKINQTHRKMAANITEYLIKNKYVRLDDFKKAYKEFCLIVDDLSIDIPDIWKYIFQYVGPLIHKNRLQIKDIWISELKNKHLGEKFIKNLILYMTKDIGPRYMQKLWFTSNLKWQDFILNDKDVKKFIVNNNFAYVENKDILYDINATTTNIDQQQQDTNKIIDRVQELLRERSAASIDEIIDYLNGNLNNIDKAFVRGFTKAICNHSIELTKNNGYKLDKNTFQACIPLLKRYIDLNNERQLQCIYAIQILINSLEHPQGLLCELIGELYEADVITQEVLGTWRESKEEPAGKGVALLALNPYFKMVFDDNSNDDKY